MEHCEAAHACLPSLVRALPSSRWGYHGSLCTAPFVLNPAVPHTSARAPMQACSHFPCICTMFLVAMSRRAALWAAAMQQAGRALGLSCLTHRLCARDYHCVIMQLVRLLHLICQHVCAGGDDHCHPSKHPTRRRLHWQFRCGPRPLHDASCASFYILQLLAAVCAHFCDACTDVG